MMLFSRLLCFHSPTRSSALLKSQYVFTAFPRFPGLPFPAEIRGATVDTAQAERFPRLRRKICDISNFFFNMFFLIYTFYVAASLFLLHFYPLCSKEALPKITEALKKGRKEHSQMLGQFP